MTAESISEFQRHAAPVIEGIVGEFGTQHGVDVVRSYATGVLAVNSYGLGSGYMSGSEIVEHMRGTAKVITTELKQLPDGSVRDVPDTQSFLSLVRDEGLTHAIFEAFQGSGIHGEDPV